MTMGDMARRMLVGGLALGLASLGGAKPTPAQEFGFRSLGAAEDAAARIMEEFGLLADFEIVVRERSSNGERFNNAAAMILSPCGNLRGCRVIVYDPQYLLDIEQETDEWGPVSIMAHEVAHHLLGHSVFLERSNPTNELHADLFSGFVLQKLGASLESAQAVMRSRASPTGSHTHPPRRERLQAIAMGWRKAAASGGAGGASEALESARAELEAMRAELGRLEGRFQESEARASEAEARAREAQVERDAAEEALRDVQARGGAADAEIRAAEERLGDANARVRAAESEIAEAQAARAAAEAALVAAEERARFGEEAAVTADRAFLLAVLLVPLVLAALVLALRKPRREIGRVMDRASQVFRGLRRGPDGSIDQGPFPPAGRRPASGSVFTALRARENLLQPVRDEMSRITTYLLGRDPRCDYCIDDVSVSRRHAELVPAPDGRFHVTDRGSTGGTFVRHGREWTRVQQAWVGPADRIRFGGYEMAAAELAVLRGAGAAPDAFATPLPAGPADPDPGADFRPTPAPPAVPARDGKKRRVRRPARNVRTGEIVERKEDR